MKPWPAIWLLLILAGCVADEAAKKAASDAYGACMMAAVARLDDGRSDPASVALGVSAACAPQYLVVSDTVVSGMITERGQDYMRAEMRSRELQLATNAVLNYRTAQRR